MWVSRLPATGLCSLGVLGPCVSCSVGRRQCTSLCRSVRAACRSHMWCHCHHCHCITHEDTGPGLRDFIRVGGREHPAHCPPGGQMTCKAVAHGAAAGAHSAVQGSAFVLQGRARCAHVRVDTGKAAARMAAEEAKPGQQCRCTDGRGPWPGL